MEWKSKWIWDNSGEHPRNQWSCFRRTFTTPSDYESVTISISADTKYTLYLNGELIGSGPVRGWQSEWHYDQYELTNLNKGNNVISVLVNHYGMSTMHYIEGRGGLIAQLDFYERGQVAHQLITDEKWKTANHDGFIKETVKMSNCLSWSEIYDARLFSEEWTQLVFDDSFWDQAIVIGSCGMEPWKKLIPRDIPHLTDEVTYPKNVRSLKEVTPIPQHFSIDLKPTFFPDEYDNNSGKIMQGYVVTEIHSEDAQEGVMTLTFDPHAEAKWEFSVNGKEYKTKNGKYENIKLQKGSNLLIVDVGGFFHEPIIHLAFDLPEKITVKAPFSQSNARFIAMGPFYRTTQLQIGYPVEKSIPLDEEYVQMKDVKSLSELESFKKWAKEIPNEHVCTDHVALLSMFKKDIKTHSLPFQHQNMVLPNQSFTYVEPMENGDTEYLIDFGKEYLGHIEFEVEASKGTVFDFFLFESIHQDGRIEHTFSLNNSLRYVAKEGRQVYRSFIPRGFRFMMLTIRNLNAPCKIHSVKVNVTTFPTGNVGGFSSSDYLLNKIWDISKHTIRMCAQDTIIDCPAYEQALWTGDSYNISLMNYYAFGNYDLVKRCLRLISKSVYRSPLPESHVPSGWQNVLTAWSILWVMSCREYYRYTADQEFIEEVYPELKLTIERFKGFLNKDGLIEISAWNMLDWAPMDTNHTIVTHQNALLVDALRQTAYLSSVLGEVEDEKEFLLMADELKQAINMHLWDDTEKVYIDSIHEDGALSNVHSIQTNLVVYLTDCAEGERRGIVEDYIVNPPEDFVHIKSPFVLFFYYQALMNVGKNEMVLDNIRDIYGYMLEHDATTCWEGWELIEGDFSRSHCHAWSAAPTYVFGVLFLGVKPLEPGFKKVSISPNLNGLKWIKGSVPIPQGKIDIYCKDLGDYIDLQITLPDEVEVEIETSKNTRVKVNGKEFVSDTNNMFLITAN
ncbi:family 78 glycoside hydrolase catalytic domain [Litchfieldia salsa]|uniref:Alpha-L-rhamnosidase N-terminal domain-containing protein n=1 Tax=Litchfieldia salsa TaxID=930152 RepID=A0A1H0PYP6_9BACI|nr:family 78 glycoside hydrolase catalytic domain [Litchfieldia salsa]SDP10164.1 Alpha-L-rhamnosidase N-terminal domain-containing protein [Litchfieldia salsa]